MSMTTFAALAGALAILQILSFVLGVLKLRSDSAVTVPKATVVDPAWLEPSWLECARATVERLGELGFVHRTYLDGLSPRSARAGIRCVTVLVNEATGDVVQVAVTEKLDGRGGIEMVAIPIFNFAFGGRRIVTSNTNMPGVFLRARENVAQSFPMVHNVAVLHRVHRAVCAKHAGASRRGQLPAVGNEAVHVNRDAANEFAYQSKRGMLNAKPDGTYERTWRGAIYGVWKLHPRLIGWQRGRMATQAYRTLAELGIDPDAPVMPNGPGTPMSSDGASSAAA